jgi:hypothetical protein
MGSFPEHSTCILEAFCVQKEAKVVERTIFREQPATWAYSNASLTDIHMLRRGKFGQRARRKCPLREHRPFAAHARVACSSCQSATVMVQIPRFHCEATTTCSMMGTINEREQLVAFSVARRALRVVMSLTSAGVRTVAELSPAGACRCHFRLSR